MKPKITKFTWLLVDKPWDFYSIFYELNNYAEHIVYIPAFLVGEENIVDFVAKKLRADFACTPMHVKRVTKEMKDAANRSTAEITRKRAESKLDKSCADDG